MEILHTDKAPAAIGPYSQAIETGGLIFASGQLGLIPDTGALAHSMAAQTVQGPGECDLCAEGGWSDPESCGKDHLLSEEHGGFLPVQRNLRTVF